jgi:membrane-associated protein
MQEVWEFIQTLLSPKSIIEYGGLVLLCIVVFVESGVFFGFFLPGDSLILTGGVLTATGIIDQPIVIVEVCLIASAILGYLAGYWFGFSTGPALYKRKDSLFFRKSYIRTAEEHYKKYGGSTLIIGRFLPVIRTFAPILAGIIKMKPATFMLYNITGSLLWIGSFCTIGYIFGDILSDYMGYIVAGLVFVTSIPIVRTLMKNRASQKAEQGKK